MLLKKYLGTEIKDDILDDKSKAAVCSTATADITQVIVFSGNDATKKRKLK